MSVSTKGVVLTPVKDVMLVCALMERALNKLLNHGAKLEFPDTRRWGHPQVRKMYGSVDWRLMPETEGAIASLTLRGHPRQLSVYFSCDCDNVDLAPQSLYLSLGAKGASGLIMKTALYALSLLGDVYFQQDDCGGESKARLPYTRLDIPAALTLGFVNAWSVEKWAQRHLAGEEFFVPGAFNNVFGCSETWFRRNQQTGDHQLRWKHLQDKLRRDVTLPDFWPQELADFGPAKLEMAQEA